MPARIIRLVTGLLALLGTVQPGQAEERLISLQTPRGALLDVLLVLPDTAKSDGARAVAVLFAGGHGRLALSDGASGPALGWGKGNSLVRNRQAFAAEGLVVALPDAPSDRQNAAGLFDSFRTSPEHVGDIDALIARLQADYGLPVWLIGTSRGTESAAYAAIHAQQAVAGLVLTAPMSVPNAKGTAVTELPLDRIRVPSLILTHENDGCRLTPPDGAQRIAGSMANAPQVRVERMTGGPRSGGESCRGQSAHGFHGQDADMVAHIVGFIADTTATK